jgi:AcrR family transcriptional regulator
MSTIAAEIGPETAALASNALSRKPRQGRSLASYDRMLSATRQLMLEHGSENFTLQDVSDLGNVSIGSIYLRFESKDRLLHAVIAEEMSGVIAAEQVMLSGLLKQCTTLGEFLPQYLERYSTLLEQHSRMLRAVMQRAAIDPAVSGPGKETARRSTTMSVDAIMHYASEINGEDPREKAEAAFQIVFAAIARQFGLGSTPESGDEVVWTMMKRELSKMVLAYLRFDG